MVLAPAPPSAPAPGHADGAAPPRRARAPSRSRSASRSATHWRTRAASCGCSRSQASTRSRCSGWPSSSPSTQALSSSSSIGSRSCVIPPAATWMHPAWPGLEQAAQRGARAAHARHHRAHRDVQHLGHLGIAELLDTHQQQRLALLGRQPRQCGQQVQTQPDIHAGITAQAVLRDLQLAGVDNLHSGVFAPHVLMGVVRDRQQPGHHVALLVELLPMRQGAFQRVLHQVVALSIFEHQRARIAPQPRHGAEQLLTENAGGRVHLMGLRLGRADYSPPLEMAAVAPMSSA